MEQVSKKETAKLLELLRATFDAEGEVVEMGCYRGDTSLLFAKELRETEKTLFLYDSFEGLPEKTFFDSSIAGEAFQKGELYVSKREVVTKLRAFRNVRIKKAWFEELGPEDLPEKICFGFLDGDLYESIKTSLKLSAEKVSPGGIIVVHDYNNPELPGATRAAEEFRAVRKDFSFSTFQTLGIFCKRP